MIGLNVIHSELSKYLTFDYTTKSYMHKPQSIEENGIWHIRPREWIKDIFPRE